MSSTIEGRANKVHNQNDSHPYQSDLKAKKNCYAFNKLHEIVLYMEYKFNSNSVQRGVWKNL